LAIRCDVADDAQVEAMVEQTVATFGRLDAAYNNAGVQNVLAETADSPRDDYDRVMGDQPPRRLELHEVRAAADAQARQRSHRQLLFAWRTCRRQPTRDLPRRKARSIGFTKSAALEYATRGIRVNAVCPGMIRTPMSTNDCCRSGRGVGAMLKTNVPMGRMGRPEEIADAVLWLCSSAASYVTGQSISVDGGYVMR
jgi:NAD(P)-dependent dehydrogenase (short-subunit alcohol dehydrogenase family)